jgi:hypothetical protein
MENLLFSDAASQHLAGESLKPVDLSKRFNQS